MEESPTNLELTDCNPHRGVSDHRCGLCLPAIAFNLGNVRRLEVTVLLRLWRRLVLPKRTENQSLTSLSSGW